jgi:hypothetical protein
MEAVLNADTAKGPRDDKGDDGGPFCGVVKKPDGRGAVTTKRWISEDEDPWRRRWRRLVRKKITWDDVGVFGGDIETDTVGGRYLEEKTPVPGAWFDDEVLGPIEPRAHRLDAVAGDGWDGVEFVETINTDSGGGGGTNSGHIISQE